MGRQVQSVQCPCQECTCDAIKKLREDNARQAAEILAWADRWVRAMESKQRSRKKK